MKIQFNLSLRPSSIVHAIEEGFIGAGQLCRDVGIAAYRTAGDYAHRVKLEIAARRIADGEATSERVAKGDDADLLAIQFRLEELLAAKRAKQAAARGKVTVPADRGERHAAG